MRGRIKTYVPDCGPKAIFGDVKINQRSPDKDSGRVNSLVERHLAINQKHTQSTLAKLTGALQTRQAGAHNSHIVSFHRFASLVVSLDSKLAKVLCIAK
jgi:hypothetical protein